jgi:hypothetical protein
MNTVNKLLRLTAATSALASPASMARAPDRRSWKGAETDTGLHFAAGADRMIYDRGLIMKRTTMAALGGILGLVALTLCADPGFAQSTSNSGALSGSNSNSKSN